MRKAYARCYQGWRPRMGYDVSSYDTSRAASARVSAAFLCTLPAKQPVFAASRPNPPPEVT